MGKMQLLSVITAAMAVTVTCPLILNAAPDYKYRVDTKPEILGIMPFQDANGGNPKVTVNSTVSVKAWVKDEDERCDKNAANPSWQKIGDGGAYKPVVVGAGTIGVVQGRWVPSGAKIVYTAPAQPPQQNPKIQCTPSDTWGLTFADGSTGPTEPAGRDGTQKDGSGTMKSRTLEIVTDHPTIELDGGCNFTFNPVPLIGAGRYAKMKAVPGTKNWDGYVVDETVSAKATTCTDADFVANAPGGANSHTSFLNLICRGSSSFTVGQSNASGYGCQNTTQQNRFYDRHSFESSVQYFAQGFTGCTITCDQDYTAGSNNAGSFTIVYSFGAINGGNVSGTVTKQ